MAPSSWTEPRQSAQGKNIEHLTALEPVPGDSPELQLAGQCPDPVSADRKVVPAKKPPLHKVSWKTLVMNVGGAYIYPVGKIM